MKRQLSSREIFLLGILLLIGVVGGYLTLFYMPMTQELESLQNEKITCEEQLNLVIAQAEEKQRMEKELDEIFAANPNPVGLAPYDNQKMVMFELNSILQSTEEYYLSFGTVAEGDGTGIVSRQISLNFTTASYEEAKDVLTSLHDSAYRCMLDDLNISLDEEKTAVSTTLVFFEYQ